MLIIAACITASLVVRPVTDAWAYQISSRASSAAETTAIANRLYGAEVDYKVTRLDIWRQFLPVTIMLQILVGVVVAAMLVVPLILVYIAFVRKLFVAVANPRSPWITIQQQLPRNEMRRLRFENDRLFYQYLSRLYRETQDNPNLAPGEKQVILAYLVMLMRNRQHRERIAGGLDPYSYDYE
jgi:hypothetical protein